MPGVAGSPGLLFVALGDRVQVQAVGPVARHRCNGQTSRNFRRSTVLSASNVKNSAPYQQIKEFGFLKDFDEKYKLADLIGKGTFASVFLAFDRETGERFAVKSLPKRFRGEFLQDYFVQRVQHEVDVYTSLGCSLNIAYLYGVYEKPQSVEMVMELCTGGELWRRIKKGKYSEQDAARIVREILRAIAQCHAKNVVVRDVKPENFLFLHHKDDAPLKAIDFGLAEHCSPKTKLSDRCGSPVYVAPEVLRQNYGHKCDIWSAGVIAYQLLTGHLPFSGEEGLLVSQRYMDKQMFSNKEAFRAVLYADLDFESPPWDELSHQACDFVKSLLERNPKKRPTAEKALGHRWLNEEEGSASSAPLNTSLVQRLQRFGTYGRLKQAALRKVAEFVAADNKLVEDLAKAFRDLDPSGSGRVEHEDVANVLKNGGFDLSDPEIRQLLAQMDVDNDGLINYPSWLAAVVDWRQIQDSTLWSKWVTKAFEIFDTDGSGTLTRDELTAMLCGDFCELADTVPAALREADVDGDGFISFKEFAALMKIGKEDRLELFDSRFRNGHQ